MGSCSTKLQLSEEYILNLESRIEAGDNLPTLSWEIIRLELNKKFYKKKDQQRIDSLAVKTIKKTRLRATHAEHALEARSVPPPLIRV